LLLVSKPWVLGGARLKLTSTRVWHGILSTSEEGVVNVIYDNCEVELKVGKAFRMVGAV
jgi:hypothetical protein